MKKKNSFVIPEITSMRIDPLKDNVILSALCVFVAMIENDQKKLKKMKPMLANLNKSKKAKAHLDKIHEEYHMRVNVSDMLENLRGKAQGKTKV